jgi:hypothetical protein
MNVVSPARVRHRFVQRLDAPPPEVFSLLCPVRETEWLDGWMPQRIVTTSGFAEIDCVFLTDSGEGRSIWIVTDHDPRTLTLRMYRVISDLAVIRIDISLAGDVITEATVSYEFTAVSETGEAYVEARTDEWWNNVMKRWENSMNYFLTTGRRFVSAN